MSISLKQQRNVPVTGNVSHVLFKAAGAVPTQASIRASVSRMFDGKVRMLENSAYYPSDNDDMVAAFVEVNTDRKLATEAAFADMKNVAPNVFIDDEENIWRSVQAGDTKMLVRDSDDDLTSILKARRGVSIDTASLNLFLGEQYNTGEGVVWYDIHNEEYCAGIAVSDTHVFDLDKQVLTEVSEFSSVLVHETDVNVQEVALDLDGDGDDDPLTAENALEVHLEYMKTLYAQNSVYFNKLKELIKGAYGDNLQIGG